MKRGWYLLYRERKLNDMPSWEYFERCAKSQFAKRAREAGGIELTITIERIVRDDLPPNPDGSTRIFWLAEATEV